MINIHYILITIILHLATIWLVHMKKYQDLWIYVKNSFLNKPSTTTFPSSSENNYCQSLKIIYTKVNT